MGRTSKCLGIVVILVAVISLAMGIVFVQQGFAKESFLTKAMKQEQIKFEGVEGIVDNAAKAQLAGDTVREHRHSIAPTYGDLLGAEHFNPTDPKQLTYAQALNLENYLYLAVASFGVFTIAKAVGAFMILVAIGFASTGVVLLAVSKKLT